MATLNKLINSTLHHQSIDKLIEHSAISKFANAPSQIGSIYEQCAKSADFYRRLYDKSGGDLRLTLIQRECDKIEAKLRSVLNTQCPNSRGTGNGKGGDMKLAHATERNLRSVHTHNTEQDSDQQLDDKFLRDFVRSYKKARDLILKSGGSRQQVRELQLQFMAQIAAIQVRLESNISHAISNALTSRASSSTLGIRKDGTPDEIAHVLLNNMPLTSTSPYASG